MNKEEKKAMVERLQADLEPGGHMVLAEYRGLTVEELSGLRKKIRAASGTIRVAKNTLLRRAVEGTAKDAVVDLLTGPNAVVSTKADPVPVVKAVAEAAKDMEAIQVKGGFIEGKAMSAEDILRIATLPSRDELLGKMLGSMSAPMQGFVNACQGVTRNLVYALEAVRQAKAAGA